jgi:hypothetical protein
MNTWPPSDGSSGGCEGLQVDARFGGFDAFYLADPLEDFGKFVQRGGMHFGQEVPSAVGVVQGG